MGSVDGFVSFRSLCGVLSSPFVFGLNRAFECDPLPSEADIGRDSVFLACAGLI